MSEHERLLDRLGALLSQVARPHRCDDGLPGDVQAGLWELGFPCSDETSREELIAGLWARKRSLLLTIRQEWGGPGITPPTAA
jgi:hypothetical protein